MSKPLAKPPPPSRYSYGRLTEEIERAISSRQDITQKDVASYINLTEPQMTHRMKGRYAKFTIEHIGGIADFLDAPDGWPLLAWKEAAKRDKRWQRRHPEWRA